MIEMFQKLSKKELIKLLEIKEHVKNEKLLGTEDAIFNLRKFLQENKLDYSREHFGVMLLDTQNIIINTEILFIGTLDKSHIEIRELFKVLFKYDRCKNIILFHNHPSGQLKPSKPDIDVTKKIKNLASELGFNCHDHFIINDYCLDYNSINDFC
jgi:DNA repair protein RadC